MRDNLLHDLVQPKDCIAPGDGMLLPLVALDFFEIVFCPAERIVVLAVGKVGISEAVSVEFRKRNTLAPGRIGVLDFARDQGKYPVKQATGTALDLPVDRLLRGNLQGLVRD